MKKKIVLLLSTVLISACFALPFVGCGGDKVDDGKKEFKFAAAFTNLDDVEGEGFSGGPSGVGMIVQDIDGEWNTESGYYVGYLFVENTTLTFEIESNKAVDDAKIVLRLSAIGDGGGAITLTSSKYTVSVNGEALQYEDISFYDRTDIDGVYAFEDYLAGENVSLKEGKNVIKLISSNNESLGGTTKATAPLVDCVKITTSAELTWTPKESNLDHFA